LFLGFVGNQAVVVMVERSDQAVGERRGDRDAVLFDLALERVREIDSRDVADFERIAPLLGQQRRTEHQQARADQPADRERVLPAQPHLAKLLAN
jgi:hypothetical protein